MVDLLHDHKIDGFLVDRYALVLFYTFFHNHSVYSRDVSYIKNYGVLTEVRPNCRKYMYGVLVKRLHHYNFLKEFVQSNRDVLDGCNQLFLNNNSRSARIKKPMDPSFSMAGEMFWPTIHSLTTILLVALIIGVVYEFWKKNKWFHKMQNAVAKSTYC